MTILKFWQLEIKAFFRAPQWEVAAIAKIFVGLIVLFLFMNVIALGAGIYYILEKPFPNQPTIDLINQGVFFLFLIEFITRFFFQQPPSTQVQSWILLPIKRGPYSTTCCSVPYLVHTTSPHGCCTFLLRS